MSRLLIAFAIFSVIGLSIAQTCRKGETPCPLDKQGREIGCCPYPEAVCCNDYESCCPGGYTCNLSQGRCDIAASPFLAFLNTEPQVLAKLESNGTQLQGAGDIMACLSEIKPLISNVATLIAQIKEGNTQGIIAAVMELVNTGYQLGVACAKIFVDSI